MENILVFGVASELIDRRSICLPSEIDSVGKLRTFLCQRYPGLKALNSLMIAVNKNYAEDDHPISGQDEIAVIPPVSGG